MKKLLILLSIFAVFVCISVFNLEAQIPGGSQGFTEALSWMDSAFAQEEATSLDAYYLGRAVAANILTSYMQYTGNPELTRYLNQICRTIVINSNFPELYNGYHVMILDSPEFNALATPGGHIFITKGLVEACNSEDMLAAIIAHELAHIMLKHSLSIIEDMRFYDEMSAMADRAVQFAGNTEAAARFTYFRNSVAATIDTLVKNGYSQDQEFEADEGSIVLLAGSGYNPQALLEILQILQNVQHSELGGFNYTHPTPSERIEHAARYASQFRIQDTRSYSESRFKNK